MIWRQASDRKYRSPYGCAAQLWPGVREPFVQVLDDLGFNLLFKAAQQKTQLRAQYEFFFINLQTAAHPCAVKLHRIMRALQVISLGKPGLHAPITFGLCRPLESYCPRVNKVQKVFAVDNKGRHGFRAMGGQAIWRMLAAP